MTERPDLYNLFGASSGMPAGWRWYALEALDGVSPGSAVLITGAVCTATFSRGARVGQVNWAKRDKTTDRKLVATKAQLDAVRDAWEAETGKCSDCGGSGQQAWGWGSEGAMYRHCRRCGTTGGKP